MSNATRKKGKIRKFGIFPFLFLLYIPLPCFRCLFFPLKPLRRLAQAQRSSQRKIYDRPIYFWLFSSKNTPAIEQVTTEKVLGSLLAKR